MADPNTRQGKRTPVTLKIKFKSETLEQFIERYAVDVSQGGIFIRTKEPLAVGTQMRFEFQLRDASPLIGGEGTVVWTRENDPSRPAIAPGMGVRFDRLADGSQIVLERILAEKAKQAPQRPPADTAKPPLFTDTPTRVAPAPIQDKLLGNEARSSGPIPRMRGGPTGEPFNDQHTPLPKPMPFHSDADEFPDEAFEEATKVRALDELVAQTAVDPGASNDLLLPADELAARRTNAIGHAIGPGNPAIGHVPGRGDATLNDGMEDTIPPLGPEGGKASSTALGMPKATYTDRDSAPGLPSPPNAGGAHPLGHSGVVPPKAPPRMLDTSPSPRTETTDPMERLAKTRLGMEPVNATGRSTAPSAPPPMGGPQLPAPTLIGAPPPPLPLVSPVAETRPSGMRAVAAEPTTPTRVAAPKSKSIAPVVILILVLLAGGSAAVWFFYLREKAVEQETGSGGGTNNAGGSSGSSGSTGSAGSQVASGGNGSNDGSAKIATGGSGGSAEVPPPKAQLVDLEIGVPAGIEKADVAVEGTDQKGPAPFKAKLEKDKAYKVRISAPHMKTLVLDVKGGQTDKPVAKLEPKPHSISFTSQPPGALIYVDGAATDKVTPFKLDLTKAQAAKKTVRVGLRKAGFKPIEKIVSADQYVEDAEEEVAKVDEKLVIQPAVVVQPPPPNRGSGGSGSGGSASTGGSGGSAETPPPPTGGSDTTNPNPNPGSASKPPESGSGKTPTPPPTGSGSEPEPDFLKR